MSNYQRVRAIGTYGSTDGRLWFECACPGCGDLLGYCDSIASAVEHYNICAALRLNRILADLTRTVDAAWVEIDDANDHAEHYAKFGLPAMAELMEDRVRCAMPLAEALEAILAKHKETR